VVKSKIIKMAEEIQTFEEGNPVISQENVNLDQVYPPAISEPAEIPQSMNENIVEKETEEPPSGNLI
jgi:hypothetical protein